jgi:hypothetical protein
MTLFVMSAFVAFNGFPGQDVETPIGNLVVQERPAPVSVPDVAVVAPARQAATTQAAARHRMDARGAAGPTASTGLIKQRRVSAPTTQAPAAQAPATSSDQSRQALPVQQTTPELPTSQVLPDAPQIQLPVIQSPAGSQQPLIDTQKVVGLLTGGQ